MLYGWFWNNKVQEFGLTKQVLPAQYTTITDAEKRVQELEEE